MKNGKNSLIKKIYSLDWDYETLAIGEKICDKTGAEIWFGGELFYGPFWNKKFGPPQEASLKEIFIYKSSKIEKIKNLFIKENQQLRWVFHMSEQGYSTETANTSMNFLVPRVRFKNEKLEFLGLTQSIVSDLYNGVIDINESVLRSIEDAPTNFQELFLQITKILESYPALKLKKNLDMVYAKYYKKHIPTIIYTEWEEIQNEVWKHESGGNQKWNSTGFTSKEIKLANEIYEFYRSASKVSISPPTPIRSKLPIILEESRQKNAESKKINMPHGYYSWLDYITKEASDAEFREWFFDQINNPNPIGGMDNNLDYIIQYTKNKSQKSTHFGFGLHKHIEEATLQLSTDPLFLSLKKKGISIDEIKKIRQLMRIAMLYHDIGKTLNIFTPGAHEGVGAKLWLKMKPTWISEEKDINFVAWLIKTHDIFGRLARGLTEKKDFILGDLNFDVTALPSYKGSLDPQSVRNELIKSNLPLPIATIIHKSIWVADIGSVASLRWVLPIADKLEELILSTCSPHLINGDDRNNHHK